MITQLISKKTRMNVCLSGQSILYRRIAFCLLMFFTFPLSQAGTEIYRDSLSGTTIAANKTLSAKDKKYNVDDMASNPDIREQRVKNIVTLRLDHSAPGLSGNFDATVKFDIQYKDEFGETNNITGLSLSVSYRANGNDQYTDRRSYLFEGGHSVDITITEVSGIHAALKLDNIIQVERLYNFDYSAPEDLTIDLSAVTGEYTISWKKKDNAEEYQLEWLHVNNYNGVDLPYDFSQNATRITTKETSYKVSSLFEKGFVLFRVRAVTYESLDRKYAIAGKWSCEDAGKCSGNNASGYIKDQYVEITDNIRHTGDDLNWQYITNYAEEGKKKEVVTYYDGTMRPHQAVTRLNTDNNIIVGETYYDRQGRPAVQALPVPVVDPNEKKSLRFYTDFNKNVKGEAYGRDNFDKGTVPCELSAEEMQTTSGSSMYYSENNPDLADPAQAEFNRFIPQAEGYPFSQTEYTADNTGRIKRQGGVGADYQLGSNHETRYLYSTPNQDELNRLFGGEAGYSAHYKKNTVIDANGQLSVSYMDMYGRVVATALTGSPATSMSGLPSYYAAKDTIVNILNNRPAADGSFSIRNTYFHTVTTAAPQKFDYILPDIHFDSEGNLTTDICLDCVYDLTIDIVDECGKRPELTDGEGKLPITRTVGALNYVCGESKPLEDIEFSFTTERLEIGTYAISRTLTVNKGALEANTTRYVDSISGIPKLKEIVDAEKAKADLDACKKPNCEEDCLLSLGENATYEEFMSCKVDCEYISECSILEDILASDFMPGIKMEGEERFGKYTEDDKEQVMGGQYALYKITSNGSYTAGDDYSIFTTANLDRVYTKFGNFFTDRNGDPIEKHDIKALVENFDLKWAKKLALEYHPEKCKLETCKANEANGSLKYDYLMSITETYEEAYNLGLLNPLGLPGAGLPPATEAQKDPFFKSGGLGYASRSQMEEYMLNDIISASNILDTDLTVSIWRKAVLMSGVCKEFAKDELIDGELTDEEKLYVASNLNSCLNAMNSYVLAPLQNTETEICSRDRVWTFFRALYRAGKEQIKTGLPSPDGCTTVDSKKRKRFPENTDLFSPDELEVINSNGSDMSQINKLKGNAESEMKKMCEVQAFAQVDKIMDELTQCKIISSGLVWDDTNEDYKKIKKAFTDIMIYTCDMTNIFGSSDIPADLIATKPDSIKYISFDAALKDILGEENINMDCNAELISFPKKSGHEYTELVAYKLLDSCGCTKLLEADEEYRSKKARNLLPLSVTTSRKYFEEEYGFSIDNYQAKICLCTNEMLNPVNINERLARYGEFIPRGISCETCVDCDMIKEKLQQFKMRHPFLPAIYINVFHLVAQDQIRNPNEQRMIENYLNSELNLNKNYGEYYTFLNGCYRLEEETDGYVCNETPDIRAGRLINIIETVTKEPITEQCIIPEMNPDVRTVFPELADNNCKNYLYDVSASEDTTLIISIYDPKNSVSSACPVKLRFVDNLRDYSYNNILHFNKNSIRTAPETDPDNNNLFLIDATIDYGGKMITATLRIEACFPVFICYDSEHKGGYTLCPRPQATHKMPEGDCAESLILAAMKNAERIYETILDSTITAFRTDYSLQCLTTTGKERLDMSFKANERHYTLYYYDQAGNLVRTIPPEGVVPIAVSLFDKINEDRDNDTMTVFTKHRMETRYLYNSLNQLTHQYMPDHDAFEDISLTGKNSGLPGNLNIDAMSFTGAEGILFGTTPSSNGQSAGYVTYNGGESWDPITDLGINNLNGLCKIPGTGAICIVGDKGTLLKSSGSTRTTVNTQVRENIVSVNFTSSSNGYFFTESGKVYRTVNGGDAWTFASNIGVSKLEHVRFISATTGYAVGRSGNEGAVYVTTNGGLNWLREQAVVSNLANIHAVNDQTAYASDERGILLKITSTGSGWETRPVVSRAHLNFMKMQFTAQGKAVALTTEGYLQVSLDGGASWNAPNGAEDQEYLDIAFTEGRAYLLRDDNKIFRRSFSDNFNTQADITPGDLSGSLKTIYFESINTGYVAGEDGLIYYTADGGTEWTRLIPDDQFGEKEIIAVYSNPSELSPVVHVVTSDKKLYRGDVQIQMNENNVEFSQVPLDGAEVKSSAFNPSGKGYVLTTDDKIYTNAGNGGGTWENTNTISGLTAIALSPDNPLNAFAVGADGKIIPTKDAFADNIAPQNISLPSLNGAAARGTTAVAVGNSGTLIQRNSSGQWEIMPVPFTANLRRAVIPAADKLIVASTGGFLYTNENPGSGLWTQYLPALTTSMINELTYAGATLFAGCSDGKIYRKNGGLMESFDPGPYSVNAILQDGATAWAVGDKGTLLRLDNFASGTDWVAQGQEITTKRITSTCPLPGGGYAATTIDGFVGYSKEGSSWEFPTNPATVNKLNVVRFFDDKTGLAAGENVILYTTDGNEWKQAAPASGTVFNDICFVARNKAFLVGNNGKIYTLEGSSFGVLNAKVSGVPENLNSVHFHNGTGYVAGDNGVILRSENQGEEWVSLKAPNKEDWTKYITATIRNLNNVTMIDQRTVYVAGDHGVILKTIDGGITWNAKESGTTENLSKLTFDGNRTALFGGTGATVVRMTDNSDRFSSRFFYDKLGRLVASQNSKQQAMDPPRYSYTHYDAQGRVTEAGEMAPNGDRELTQALLDTPDFANSLTDKRYYVTRTKYDSPLPDLPAGLNERFSGNRQENLRNRVAAIAYYEDYSQGEWSHATHFSYDIHGNVKELIHDNSALKKLEQRFKKIEYEYDLISGNVNKVIYQPDMPDRICHKYEYDADNRITKVYTSLDGLVWDNDASYKYYKHGPLARTEIGDLKVQGIDYAYTLQGWIKAVNSNSLDENVAQDMGGDGNGVAKDAFGYSLHYNANDYKAIGGTSSQAFLNAVSSGENMTNLYNGNISRMATAISENVPGYEKLNLGTQVRDFKYDELNRLVSSAKISGKGDENAYATTYKYDANGNINNLTRRDQEGSMMDDFTYRYIEDGAGNRISNRLLHVNDAVRGNSQTVDLKDQGAFIPNNPESHNYTYDKIGNLIADKQEEIEEIVWNVQGKVQEIRRTANSSKPDLLFKYDAMGRRVSKTVIPRNVVDADTITTFYVHDAQGNVMATYEEKQYNNGNEDFMLKEQHLYGSSRLGMRKTNLLLAKTDENIEFDLNQSYRMLGEKNFELSNHLGNVLAVVSDKRLANDEPDVIATYDYYPFGMQMPGRTIGNLSDSYRYGFGSHEKDDEVSGNGNHLSFGDYGYDPRLGRRWNIDPLWYELSEQSPYSVNNNNPIFFFDPDGKQGKPSVGQTMGGALFGWLVPPPPGKATTPLQMMQQDKLHIKIIHLSLDVTGMIPIIGEPADILNGTLYSVEGKGTDAALSFAGAIPVAGWAATTGKWAKNLLKLSDGALHSSSGLVFKLGSKEGNRLSHVAAHTADDLTKAKHGVFNAGDDLIKTLNEAWDIVKKGGDDVIKTTTDGRTSYIVDMGRKIGHEGGQKGSGDALNKIKIVVEEGTSNVVTAFPTK